MKFLTTTLLLLLVLGAEAQTPKVTTKWENSFNENLQKKGVYSGYLGEDQQSYFLWVNDLDGTNKIVKYDKNTFKQSDIKNQNVSCTPRNYYSIKNETFFYAYEAPEVIYFKKMKDPTYGFYHFNKEKMEFERLNDQFSNKDFANMENLSISPDQSKLLFVFKEKAKKKNENDSYQFYLTDTQFNKLWEKTITTPFIASSTVSNDGTVYAAITNYPDKKKDKNAYEYILVKMTGESEKRFTANMNNYLYQEIQLLTNNDNKLLALGFYSDKANEEKTGAYYFSVNNAFDKAENISYQEIPVKILTLYGKRKLNERYANYEFGTPMYGENDEIVICSEENTSRRRTTTSTSGWVSHSSGATTFSTVPRGTTGSVTTSSSSTSSQYFDIYAFRINGDRLAWAKRVPKNQGCVDGDKVEGAPMLSDRMSYDALLSGGNVVILFSDNIKKNMKTDEYSEDVAMAYGKDCNLVSVTLDKDGKQKKEIVNTKALDKDELDPEIKKSFHISNNKTIISARKKTNCKMGVITIE